MAFAIFIVNLTIMTCIIIGIGYIINKYCNSDDYL